MKIIIHLRTDISYEEIYYSTNLFYSYVNIVNLCLKFCTNLLSGENYSYIFDTGYRKYFSYYN